MGEKNPRVIGFLDTIFWRKVIDNIKSTTPEALDMFVDDYVIGARYSAVKLSSGKVGIAYSYVMEEKCTPSARDFARIWNFIPLLSSDCIAERTLGQAAFNAIGQYYLGKTDCGKKELVDRIFGSLSRNDIVVFIGALKKIPNLYESEGYKVYILDRWQSGRYILPDFYAYKVLPKAKVVYITGAAFSRPDVDLILNLSKNAEYRIEIGPSLSLPPKYLASTGLTHLETSIILDHEKVFHEIKLGRGYHDIRGSLIHISCKVI
ncbi:MAG: hypothetical protein F7B60_03570 [Desulfurococcales archaeon]|nr:hypothetical protein [Desulfurococcales archaeon]